MNKERRIYPVAVAMTVFFFLVILCLAPLGLIPEITQAARGLTFSGISIDISTSSPDTSGNYENPQRIVVPSLGIDSPVLNPTKSDVKSLDDALMMGVVKYPGSGTVGKKGNMVLLGHSSHLPFVHNKAFKSFNEINTLKTGDEIRVYGNSNKIYTYKVTNVSHVKNTDTVLDLNSSFSKITLVTCNNFGAKEDRYIVEAELFY